MAESHLEREIVVQSCLSSSNKASRSEGLQSKQRDDQHVD